MKFHHPFRLLLVFILPLLPVKLRAQTFNADSLKHTAKNARTSSVRIKAFTKLADYYDHANGDSCIAYARLAMSEALRVDDIGSAAYAESDIAETFMNRGNYVQALAMCNEELRIYQRLNDSSKIANGNLMLGLIYRNYNAPASYRYFNRDKCISAKVNDYVDLFLSYEGLTDYFVKAHRLDSALFYARHALDLHQRQHLKESSSRAMVRLATLYGSMGRSQLSAAVLKEALQQATAAKDPLVNSVELAYARTLLRANKPDSALTYANAVLKFDSQNPTLTNEYPLYTVLADIYQQKKQYQQALRYQQMAIKTRDSLNNISQLEQVSNQMFNERQREADLKNEAAAYQNKLKLYAVVIALALVIIISVIIWRNYRKQQSANILLKTQKQQIQDTLQNLKSTQNQLIQSEKMASLGELTAGIAHEIQNPLNFVNNFSEVNSELIDEMQDEIDKGNLGEVKAISADIKENEQKINMHGRRADSIVKSMLEHSRASSGQKELTDINALADEYLRLSYHGLRAKDKSFNAAMESHLDNNLPKLNLVSQDIGRVLLNLYNNAFYAVSQKKKQNPEGYTPRVTLTTINKGSFVEITVKDNGNGIPDNIKEKIMQPFFTTKPTGEGTGLGLSLSYDIVVKGHGGKIDINTKEGEFTEFIVTLPL